MSNALKKYKFALEFRKTPAEACYDFYRCEKCSRVITRTQELRARSTGQFCACGSAKASPTWPVGFEWLKAAVILDVAKFVLARLVAPKIGDNKLFERVLSIGI